MSSMLEQAIVDAAALREAALKNAEQSVIEKYAPEIKSAVQSLLNENPEGTAPAAASPATWISPATAATAARAATDPATAASTAAAHVAAPAAGAAPAASHAASPSAPAAPAAAPPGAGSAPNPAPRGNDPSLSL